MKANDIKQETIFGKYIIHTRAHLHYSLHQQYEKRYSYSITVFENVFRFKRYK